MGYHHLYRDGIPSLERVQKRATKIHMTQGMRYEERLEVFDLQKRELRRERVDFIQFFKFEKNIEKINWLKSITKLRAMKTTGPAS